MTTAYTNLLGLALPVDGELTGAWGSTINNSITSLIEDAVANFATHDVTAANWTLTTTGSGTSNEARMAMLVVTGTPGTTRSIIAPGHSKMYLLSNQSNASITVKSASTTGVTVAAGQNTIVAWNNIDFVEIKSTQVLNLAGGAASQIPYQSAAGTTTFIANGTSGQVLTSNGTSAPSWQSLAGVAVNTGTSSNINGLLKGNGSALGTVGIGTGLSWDGTTLTCTVSSAVTSVNGHTGAVTLNYSDVGAQVAGSYVSPSVNVLSGLTQVGPGPITPVGGGYLMNLRLQDLSPSATYNTPIISPINGHGYDYMQLGAVDSSSHYGLAPYTDNVSYCGSSSNRWGFIYVYNGVVQASDMRKKIEQPNTLGLNFIKALKPKVYTWIVGGYTPSTLNPHDDLVAFQQDTYAHPIAGKRHHAGFFAQEVKQALDDLGVPDFGGWLLEDVNNPDSAQSLRYEEFIAPIVKAMQEQQVMIEDLQARLTAIGA
jgi:hypothetical protein